MAKQITVQAGGRNLTFYGTFENYLKWYDGWDSAIGAHSKVTADLPQGSLCIDAGANIGIVSLTLAAQRPDLKIIAIEPIPDNVNNLRKNVQVNGIENVEVVQAAVSDVAGTLNMTDNGPWSAVQAGAGLVVPCITLDQYADRPVAFVKIDTEGYEPHVLAGGRKLFDRQKPLAFVEFNSWFLMLHHYDPIVFSRALWSSFDVLGMYYQENLVAPAVNELSIVHDNITAHGSVTDLLLRPKSRIPELDEMIYAPEFVKLRRALRTS
jgi:FkbM family methyltransferase